VQRIPGVSSATRSGPMLASIVLDDQWAHLRDGAFVVKDQEREAKSFTNDPDREASCGRPRPNSLTGHSGPPTAETMTESTGRLGDQAIGRVTRRPDGQLQDGV